MKVCSLIFFIVVYMLPVAGFGQTEDDKRFASTNTNIQYIKLTHPKEKIRINLPVSSLHVYDARFDTTSVGLTQTYLVLTPYQFKNQFTKEIHHYLSSLIQTDSFANYFKLYRIGNAFKFYGAKGVSQIRTINPLAARPIDLVNPNSAFSKTQTANKFTIIKKYLQLDMDTGNIY